MHGRGTRPSCCFSVERQGGLFIMFCELALAHPERTLQSWGAGCVAVSTSSFLRRVPLVHEPTGKQRKRGGVDGPRRLRSRVHLLCATRALAPAA